MEGSMSYKGIKNRMLKKYGTACWIEMLGLNKFIPNRTYKNKKEFKRMKQLTYHHIKPKIHGGVESEENGAILSEENHLWFHSQEKEIQEILNESFKKYQKFYEVKRKVNSNFKPTDLLNENDFITLSKEVCAQIFEIKYLKKHDKLNLVDKDLVI